MDDLVRRAREYARNLGGPPEDYLVWQMADRIEALETEGARLREAAENAYGCVWRTVGPYDGQVHHARGLLLAAIGRDGQRRGIAYALRRYGPVGDDEILMERDGAGNAIEERT
jgi:hypothetical protein